MSTFSLFLEDVRRKGSLFAAESQVPPIKA